MGINFMMKLRKVHCMNQMNVGLCYILSLEINSEIQTINHGNLNPYST